MRDIVIVLNYNDFETVAKYLRNVKKNKAIYKIIVVDNASTDGSYEKLLQLSGNKIEVISSGANEGYAKGNNFGAYYAIEKYKPEILTISNPDVLFDEEYTKTIHRYFSILEDAGIISGRMISHANVNNPVLAWKLPKFWDLMLSNFIILKKFIGDSTHYKKDYLQKEKVIVDVLPGSLFSIKTETFLKCGGFCEKTFLYEEENILAWRIKSENLKNYLIGSISYFHEHAVSINKSLPKIKNRLDIDFDSKIVYAKECLKCNKLELLMLKISYFIGKTNYLLAIRITNTKR